MVIDLFIKMCYYIHISIPTTFMSNKLELKTGDMIERTMVPLDSKVDPKADYVMGNTFRIEAIDDKTGEAVVKLIDSKNPEHRELLKRGADVKLKIDTLLLTPEFFEKKPATNEKTSPTSPAAKPKAQAKAIDAGPERIVVKGLRKGAETAKPASEDFLQQVDEAADGKTVLFWYQQDGTVFKVTALSKKDEKTGQIKGYTFREVLKDNKPGRVEYCPRTQLGRIKVDGVGYLTTIVPEKPKEVVIPATDDQKLLFAAGKFPWRGSNGKLYEYVPQNAEQGKLQLKFKDARGAANGASFFCPVAELQAVVVPGKGVVAFTKKDAFFPK